MLENDRYCSLSHSLITLEDGEENLGVRFQLATGANLLSNSLKDDKAAEKWFDGLIGSTAVVSSKLRMKFPKSELPSSGFVLSLYGLGHEFKDSTLNLSGASFDIIGPTGGRFSWRELEDDEFEADVTAFQRSVVIDEEFLNNCFLLAEKQLRLFSFNESNAEAEE